MADLPAPLERVIHELGKLPGIGKKTAQRLAFHLLKSAGDEAGALASSLAELRTGIRACTRCFNLASADEGEHCLICSDTRRDRSQICVVEEPTNLMALETTGSFRGLYHVLGGALSPLKDIGPDQLHLDELVARVEQEEVREVILATNPDVEGEATAVYVSRLLRKTEVQVTRLAQGLPAGGDLEYTDALTLKRAIEGRRDY